MSKHISRRSLVIFGILLVVGILGSCLVANQLLFHRCLWWECAPKRDFTVFDLNLPPDLFPSEADIHDLDFLRGDNVSIESASTTNYWENGVAIYIVRRFATDEQALRHYDFDAQVKFTRRSNENSNVVNYKSIEANNSSTQCGYVLNDFRCIYIARYEEFTIFFSGSIGENEMSK